MANFDYVTGRRGIGLHRLNDDREIALASLDRLDPIDAEVVLFGHGEPWTGGLRQALEDRPRNRREIGGRLLTLSKHRPFGPTRKSLRGGDLSSQENDRYRPFGQKQHSPEGAGKETSAHCVVDRCRSQTTGL